MSRPQPQEFGWDFMEKMESRRSFSHCSHYMRSANSCGPIYSWVCDYWREVHFTTVLVAPICRGNVQE